jgi:cephalosporin hydroxylase
MYNFSLGSKEQVLSNELDFLIAVKRMLPRYLNSIPDNEFIAICKLADQQGSLAQGKKAIFIETGVGASTVALYWYACKYDLEFYTWDISAAKAAMIRQVLSEALGDFCGLPQDHWKFISWDSTSPYLGIQALSDSELKCYFSFHDSDHTWINVENELKALVPLLTENSVVALDDANLQWTNVNMGLINTFRKKLGWSPISTNDGYQEFKGEIHGKLVEQFLSSKFKKIEVINDYFKDTFSHDFYFEYFNMEFNENISLGTTQSDQPHRRFDAFKIIDI